MESKTFTLDGTKFEVEDYQGIHVDLRVTTSGDDAMHCVQRSDAIAFAEALIEAAGGRPAAEPVPAKPEFLDHPDVTWPFLVTKRENGWSTNLPQSNGFVYLGAGKLDTLASLVKRKQRDYPDGYAIYTLAAVVGPEPRPQPVPEREVVTL